MWLLLEVAAILKEENELREEGKKKREKDFRTVHTATTAHTRLQAGRANAP